MRNTGALTQLTNSMSSSVGHLGPPSDGAQWADVTCPCLLSPVYPILEKSILPSSLIWSDNGLEDTDMCCWLPLTGTSVVCMSETDRDLCICCPLVCCQRMLLTDLSSVTSSALTLVSVCGHSAFGAFSSFLLVG